MANETNTNNNEVIKNGHAQVAGIDIDIKRVLGDMLVQQAIGGITEEQMTQITDYISSDLFRSRYDSEGNRTLVINTTDKPGQSSWSKEICILNHTKNVFNAAVKEKLQESITKIINSKDYSDKIDEMAEEVIEYAINGYKEDLKANIRAKMITGVMSEGSYYGGISLTDIVNQVLDNRLH